MTLTAVETNVLYATMAALAECLCGQIKDPANGVPDVCSCGIVPGDNMAPGLMDGNCAITCGQAWVRMVGAYPMKGVGQPDTSLGNCGAQVGADVELGIVRCIDVGDERGTPPEVLLAAAQLQYADALVMRKAVLCCDAVPFRDTIMGNYTPLGPAGGMVGGQWLISIAVA